MALSSLDTNKWRPLLARDWTDPEPTKRGTDDQRSGPLRQRQTRLTEEQVVAMAARYAEGATVRQLAVEFDCHRTTVALRLKERGSEMRNRPATPEEVAHFIALYRSGLSLVKVAEKTGFSEKTVMNRLRSEGVQLRDTHGRER